MKNRIRILITAVIASLLIITAGVFFSFIYSPEKVEKKSELFTEGKEKHSCCSEVETDEYSENSIYQLETEWINQNGIKTSLDKFKDKRTVLTMFFASCTYACPILVEDMKKIEAKLPKDELSSYNFVLVSIDPERDTPEVLKQFAARNNLDLTRWTLLRGTKDEIMELAALTGFKYKKDANGDFSHSNLITILNEKGEITFQHTRLNQDVTTAAANLRSINEL